MLALPSGRERGWRFYSLAATLEYAVAVEHGLRAGCVVCGRDDFESVVVMLPERKQLLEMIGWS